MNIVAVVRALALAALIPLASASDAANTLDLDAQSQCPSVYRPVCASKGSETKSFGNACLAERDGFAIVSPGDCGGSAVLPRLCAKEYAPVCGERDGERRSFGNTCEAGAEEFAVVHNGSC
jgi:hypothetical protein